MREHVTNIIVFSLCVVSSQIVYSNLSCGGQDIIFGDQVKQHCTSACLEIEVEAAMTSQTKSGFDFSWAP